MEFNIIPYKGVEVYDKGIISFGMTREQVRSFFDENPEEEIIEDESGIIYTDNYLNFSIQIQFKEQDYLQAITISPPENHLFFQDKDLLSLPYFKLQEWLVSQDSQLIKDDIMESLTSFKLGLSVGTIDIALDGEDTVSPWVFIFEDQKLA